MANEKKLTKRDYFTAILNKYALTEKEQEFVKHELELLDRKNSTEKKPTAEQGKNDALRKTIVGEMEDNRLYTISEMMKVLPSCAELSNQKLSALLRQMIADGTIVRTEDKRKAYFSLAK
jgi:hypothetical protein